MDTQPVKRSTFKSTLKWVIIPIILVLFGFFGIGPQIGKSTKQTTQTAQVATPTEKSKSTNGHAPQPEQKKGTESSAKQYKKVPLVRVSVDLKRTEPQIHQADRTAGLVREEPFANKRRAETKAELDSSTNPQDRQTKAPKLDPNLVPLTKPADLSKTTPIEKTKPASPQKTEPRTSTNKNPKGNSAKKQNSSVEKELAEIDGVDLLGHTSAGNEL